MAEARKLQEVRDSDYDEVMQELLDQRAKHLKENPEQRITADQFKAELLAKYPKK